MPVLGERRTTMGSGYKRDPLYAYAQAFKNTVSGILEEGGIDVFSEPHKAMVVESVIDQLQAFFVNESYDPEEFAGDIEAEEDHIEMMKEQFENNRSAIQEAASLASFNPVIGMSFPVHKNLLMNNMFDKGGIQKAVATTPKFTISLETRILERPDGTEIDLYTQQREIKAAMDAVAPFVEVELSLPEVGMTDILSAIGASNKDEISIESHISAVQVEISKSDGAGGTIPELVWVPTKLEFSPSYGTHDRTLMESVRVAHKDHVGDAIEDVISGTVAKNKFMFNCFKGNVKAIKLNARRETSNGLNVTPTARWKIRTDVVEIPSAMPMNTTISPDEVKDVAALYKADQLTKIMSIFRDTLGNYKDDTIKHKLDESFMTMPSRQRRHYSFDMAIRDGQFAHGPIEWRKQMFSDHFDTYATELMNVLNDPNMTITVLGRPDLIRKIKPTNWVYESPSAVGPVNLEFTRNIFTSDNRVYNFISSQKLDHMDQFIVLLKPSNSERITYRIYDYQMHISNDIRNAQNPTLPAINAYERWKFVEYQPVQARIDILNPAGLTSVPAPSNPYDVTIGSVPSSGLR